MEQENMTLKHDSRRFCAIQEMSAGVMSAGVMKEKICNTGSMTVQGTKTLLYHRC